MQSRPIASIADTSIMVINVRRIDNRSDKQKKDRRKENLSYLNSGQKTALSTTKVNVLSLLTLKESSYFIERERELIL